MSSNFFQKIVSKIAQYFIQGAFLKKSYDKKIKIGIDASCLAELNGGISYYTFYLLKELILKKQDALFYLYFPVKTDEMKQFLVFPNVVLKTIPFFRCGLSIWLQTLIAFFCWKDKINIFWGPVQAVPILKRKSLKTILSLHDFAFRLYPETVSSKKVFFMKVFFKKMIHSAHFVISVSQGTADRLLKDYAVTAACVIYPPLKHELRVVPKDQCEELLSNHNLDYGQYILSVGTWEPRKNFVKLIYIYTDILKKNQLEDVFPLVIIGSGGWKNNEIIKIFKEAQRAFPSHINLLGFVPDQDLASFYSGAYLYLTLSLYEGYGMPLAESRVCGTSVVCPDMPEMREAAENDGIFFNDQNLNECLKNVFVKKNKTKSQKCNILARYSSNAEKANELAKLLDACLL